MHRTYPSRGRVLFEVLCALGMSASFAGAWMQTHATALLGAAGVAAFYALVHLFDLRQRKAAETAEAVEPQRVEFEPETSEIVVPMVSRGQLVDEGAIEEVATAEPVRVGTGSGRRSGSRKSSSGRRAKAPKAAKLVELTPVEEVQEVAAAWPMTEVAEEEALAARVDDEEFVFPADDEPSQSHIAPLFEPEPFARMQRRAFGRRGRL